jgi:type III secretion system FlhB-like substrate exporter
LKLRKPEENAVISETGNEITPEMYELITRIMVFIKTVDEDYGKRGTDQ